MGKVQSNLRRLQIVFLFFFSAYVIDKILSTRFWKRKDSASPIENGTEDEDSTEELKCVYRDNHTQGIFAVLLTFHFRAGRRFLYHKKISTIGAK